MLADDGGLRWYRYSKLALDVIPDVLRSVFRERWHSRYGVPWTDDAAAGKLLVNGGVVGVYDIELPGTFSLRAGMSEVKTTHNVTAVLKQMMPVEIGNVAFTVRRTKPGSPSAVLPPSDHGGGHTSQGKILLDSQHEEGADDMAGVSGRTASRWVPRAVRHDGGSIDRSVKKRLETGLVSEMDTTALNCVLIGNVGAMFDVTKEDIDDDEFWARASSGTQVGGVKRFGRDGGPGGAGGAAGAGGPTPYTGASSLSDTTRIADATAKAKAGGAEAKGEDVQMHAGASLPATTIADATADATAGAAVDEFGEYYTMRRLVRKRNTEMGHRFQSSMPQENFDNAGKERRGPRLPAWCNTSSGCHSSLIFSTVSYTYVGVTRDDL